MQREENVVTAEVAKLPTPVSSLSWRIIYINIYKMLAFAILPCYSIEDN